MNSSNRLLFAAARGAWIQRLWFKLKDEPYNWELSRVVMLHHESDYDSRIHPDDEHLQYGPISTALREMATGDYEPSVYVFAASGIANYLDHRWQYRWEDTLHRSLFLLILSECLADEGL